MSKHLGAAISSRVLAANSDRGGLRSISRLSKYTSISMKLRSDGTEMATIDLKTQIPGPKSRALTERRSNAVPRGLSHATPIYVAKTEGAVLEDVDGNRYVDLAGGIGCLNTGHRAPGVLTAIERQLDKFLHTCVQVTPYESYIRLAERLNQATPGKFPKKTLLVNSGAEAVENAVKIARAATGRPGIIAFEDAFHG